MNKESLINSGILGIKFFDLHKNFKQIPIYNLTENILLKIDKEIENKRIYDMKASDLDKRETSIITHNVSYDYPTSAIYLKLKPKNIRKPLIVYVKVNEKPTSKNYDSIYYLPSKENGFNQVIPVVGNGTCYIGVKASKYSFLN